jgi:hypothetical protein
MGWTDTGSSTEAALLDRYLRERHGLSADLLEHDSTNCGANARFIAHVEVPPEVRRAFSYLRETTDYATRAADPQWAG